jgi:RNA-directed DNA polymerase
MKFNQVNWKATHSWLRQKQNLLVEVYKKKDFKKVRHIQISILKDFRTTAIAVRRVTSTSGSKTPGLDGVVVKTIKERVQLASDVHKIVRKPSAYKPLPVRRVWIPKKDGTKRPLGISSIRDRAVQAVYLEIIDPLVECNSCENSYGFRKFRSAQDAVLALRGKLFHPKASEWVLNADIVKCFDKINHDFLLRSVPVYRKVDRNLVKKMLKAKIIDVRDVREPEEGTPQGGVLSPVFCNIVLNGLEKTVKQRAVELNKLIMKKGRNPKVHIVRYADDFVVIGPQKRMLRSLIPHIKKFLAERGLEISKEKSSLFNIWESSIEFLGFSFKKRRFNYKKRFEVAWKKRKTKSTARIIILPSIRNQVKFKLKIRDIIRRHSNLSTLVLKLNTYLRGWANYFALTNDSAERVRKMHRFVLKLCWNKVVKLYPHRSNKSIKKSFFPESRFYQLGRYVKRAWVLSVPTKLERPSEEAARLKLFNLDSVRASGRGTVGVALNAYKMKDLIKLERRKELFINMSGSTEKICRGQKFICPVCAQSLTNGEDIEVHHTVSFKELSLNSFLNKQIEKKKVVALHKMCHKILHSKASNSNS